jgi:hypothetical protein
MAVINKREAAKKAALQAGRPVPEWDDAISWAEQEAFIRGAKYDPAVYQLTLSFAAIHSTSDLLAKVMLEIATHPEIVEPLRREIADSLHGQGWKKVSLYNMRLLDSVIKETQRVTPLLLGKPKILEKLSRGPCADIKNHNSYDASPRRGECGAFQWNQAKARYAHCGGNLTNEGSQHLQ